MGRGNLQKRAHQKEGSIRGGSRIDGATQRDLVDFKRKRPTRNQASSTLPNVDVHGILFAIVLIVFVVYGIAIAQTDLRKHFASMAWAPEI